MGALHSGLPDLSVYRYGGRAVLDGLPLYEADDPVTGYPFTYPPFAAVAMVPVALIPGWLAAALWTGTSVGALAAVVIVVRRALGRPAPGWLVALLTAAAVALEPVWQNLAFGQVNALLMLVVLVDLLGPERRWSGVLVGIAAGVKLTPLLFVVLLVLVGRRTAAGRAVDRVRRHRRGRLRRDAWRGGDVLEPRTRSTRPGSAHRRWPTTSRRTAHSADCSTASHPLCCGSRSRCHSLSPCCCSPPSGGGRDDRVLGTCLGALAMLIVSPISWSHHWVWALPVAIVLWERSRVACVAWVAVFIARPIVWPGYGRNREYSWGLIDHLVGNAYLLAAFALCIWAATLAGGRVPGALAVDESAVGWWLGREASARRRS